MTSMTSTQDPAQSPPWVPSDETFGARLAMIRQRMGWGNVKRAAQECGLPVESWRTWERDGVEPRRMLTIAMTIAGRTGCDYLWLVHGPARGDVTHTGHYEPGERIVAIVRSQEAHGYESVHGSHVAPESIGPTRPVSRTRPLPAAMARLAR